MSYVYIQTETSSEAPPNGLFTVGHYEPGGTWLAESDHPSAEEAAARVAYLHGLKPPNVQLVAMLVVLAVEALREAVRRILGELDIGVLESSEEAIEHIRAIVEGLEGMGSEGVTRIAAERRRQVEREGWTAEHDDKHVDAILAIAAAELAVSGTGVTLNNPKQTDHCGSLAKYGAYGATPDRVRALTIAGALIAAEIDRELRARAEEES